MADIGLWDIVHHLRRKALADLSDAERDTPPLREARLFARVLEGLPRGEMPGETLAGDFGPQFLSEADAAAIAQAIAQDAVAARAHQPEAGEPSPADLMHGWHHCCGGYTLAHTCGDYQRVVEEGLTGVLEEVTAAQVTATETHLSTLQAMQIALEAVINWAETWGNPGAHVPQCPARTFHEGLQAVWFVHAAIGLSELSDASLSLGRLDQFLYPLYQRDTENGVPAADLERSLSDLWLKLNRFGDPACTVNIGGVGEEGRDLFNPLSAMILRVSRAMRLPSPLLAVRVHPDIPQEVFDEYLDPELLSMGQPTFYGEFACREALVRRGVPEAEAPRVTLNSCMGIVIPGEEISDMWGGIANMLLPVELAANNGVPFAHAMPIALATPAQSEYGSFDGFFVQVAAYLDELAAFCVGRNQAATEHAAQYQPNPFLSALTRDCVARGLDRAGGGARYHSVIIEGFGWVNAADALVAIRRLVFEERRFTLAELAAAARRDFAGDEELHREILRCPKFGNGNAEADEIARRVTEAFAASVSRHSRGNVTYLPSYHTLNAHIGAGAQLPASLDGRRAGEPLGKNVGPMLGRATQGLTGVILSASAIDQPALSGGQALDISVPARDIARDPALKRDVQALLQTYFARGGLEVQINGLTANDLRAAIAAPALHQDLIVRIAGYSARFVSLSAEVQAEMVKRFERQL